MLRFKKANVGLLDRVFRLIVEEIKFADPDWSQRIALESLNVDSFAQAWFAERKQRDPFDWAEKNAPGKSNAINEKSILFPGVMSFCACMKPYRKLFHI